MLYSLKEWHRIDTYFFLTLSANGLASTVQWGCETVNDERQPVTVHLVVDASAEHATHNGYSVFQMAKATARVV